MPDIPPNTGIAPTSEQIQQAQAAAAAAEATNQAWKSNTLPVLPKMGGAAISNEEQVIAYDTTGLTDPKNQQGRPYLISAQEDAARESAKHEAAFHPESFYNANIGNLANVPLSQIASRYGTDFADYVQGHYTQNPTANFQAINQQYTAMQGVTVGSAPTYKQGTMVTNIGAGEGGFTGRAAEYAASWTPLTHSVKYGGEAPNSVQGYYTPVGSNPFKSDTAAGIAWDVAASGGYIGSSLAEKVVDPTTGEKINVPGAWVWDQKTSEGKQIKDYGNVVSSNQMVEKTISPGRTVYVPIGEMEQQLRTDSKLIVAERGAYEVWQTPKNTMPGSDFVRIYPMITAGGSDFALQSGMVSGKAQTPWVVDEYGMNPLWKASDAARVADIQANPQNYSRLGSELYGGIVQKLQPYPYGTIELAWGRGQTVEPGVYPAVRENFAGLVNFESVNAPKGTVSDASDLPKFGSISPEQFNEMPSLQKVDTQGNLNPVHLLPIFPEKYSVAASTASDTVMATTATVSSSSLGSEVVMNIAAPATGSSPSTSFDIGKVVVGGIATGQSWLGGASEVVGKAWTGLESGRWSAPAESTVVPGTEYSYRTDPAAVAMEGALFFGDTLLFGVATPGKDLLAAKGQSSNAKYDTFRSDLSGLEAQSESQKALGSTIDTQKASIDSMLAGKLNSKGEFTGTREEYSRYQTAQSELKLNVDKYNQFGEHYKSTVEKGVASGAIIPVGTEGAYRVNPDNEHPYGAFSDWSASITKTMRGGTSESDIIRYENSYAFKNAGIITWAGEGSWKVLTNPVGLSATALQGVEIYAGMGVVTAGFGALAPTGFATAGAGSTVVPATFVESVGVLGFRAMTNPYVQGAAGVGFVGLGVVEATEGFTAPAQRSVSNLSGLTINLAVMGGGALLPEGAAGASRYAAARFAEKPMSVETYKGTLSYTQQPDIRVASGVGGDMRLTVERTVATQPSVNVLGMEIAAPRIFEPVVRSTTTETINMGYGDVGGLLGARLTGTKAEPLVGTRVENLRLESFRSQDLAHGTGTVSIAEMRLPRTIEEYQTMGRTDARAAKMDPDDLAASLMADAARVTQPTTSQRILDINVEKGTNIRDAFDWTTDLQGGSTHQMNRINFEDYFGQMQVTRTGDASAYQTTVTRDVGEFGFGKTGQFDVTGARTPEARIVSQLQEVSGGLEKNVPERAFVFDQRGNLIYEEIGQIGAVSRKGTMETVFNQASKGETTSKVHTHPDYTIREMAGVFTDIRIPMRDKVVFAKDLVSHGGSIVNKASEGDVDLMLHDTPRFITAEYIVSDRFVMKFTPREQPLGWEGGFDTKYIGAKEVYRTSGYTERISDATTEMRDAFPEGTRNQFQNAIDRMALKNPNLEFIREPQPADVTYRAGKNPYATSGGGISNFRPGQSTVAMAEPGLAFVSGEKSQVARKGGMESVRAGEATARGGSPALGQPEYVEARLRGSTGPVVIPRGESLMAFDSVGRVSDASISRAESVSAKTEPGSGFVPASDFSQTERIKSYEIVKAFEIGSEVSQTSNNKSGLASGIIPALYVGQFQFSGTSQIPGQTPVQYTGQVPKQDTQQVPDQLPDQTPWQDVGYDPRPDPKPDPEIPPPPWLPLGGSIGGQGGSGGSLKRFKRYMEYFPVGLDISMFGTTRGANPFTNPAGRVKYMPRDAGAFESPSAKRDIKAAKYAQAIRKMKPLKVPGGRKNIFMQ